MSQARPPPTASCKPAAALALAATLALPAADAAPPPHRPGCHAHWLGLAWLILPLPRF